MNNNHVQKHKVKYYLTNVTTNMFITQLIYLFKNKFKMSQIEAK